MTRARVRTRGTRVGRTMVSTPNNFFRILPNLAAVGPPKRRLVLWSERIANQVEVRLKTQIVPEIQCGFRAYLENEVVPGIEDRVLSSLKQRVEEQKGFPTTHALDPPPYNALSVSPIQLQMAHEADGTPGCKRRCELALSLPGAEGPPGMLSFSFIGTECMYTKHIAPAGLAGKRERLSES